MTVSGPSPHTSRPLSRSDHARVSVSAFGMYHSVRFGTDHSRPCLILVYCSPFDPRLLSDSHVYYSTLVAEDTRRTNLYSLASVLRSRAIPTPDLRPVARSRAFRPADPNTLVRPPKPGSGIFPFFRILVFAHFARPYY